MTLNADTKSIQELLDSDARRERLESSAEELLDILKRAVGHAETHDDYDWIGAAVRIIKKIEQ